MVRSLLYGFITIIVGLSLLGPVNEMVVDVVSENGGNLTGWSATTTKMITGFFALALVAAGIALVVKAFEPAIGGGMAGPGF